MVDDLEELKVMKFWLKTGMNSALLLKEFYL